MKTTTDRFQWRRWPDNCPLLVGELAVVDTLHQDRIVRTYNGRKAGFDAFDAAKADCIRWNTNPPTLMPRLVFPEIVSIRQQDGTIRLEQKRTEKRGILKESSYADYEYVNLD